MARTYEQRVQAYQSACIEHARVETNMAKSWLAFEDADNAGHFAARAATWAFTAYPEFREA